MQPRTDVPSPNEAPEFSREYLLTLSAMAAVVLFLVFGVEFGIVPRYGIHDVVSLPLAFPWIVAAGHTISNGLNAFGGHTSEVITGEKLWSVLFPLLLVGVIGPTLTLLLMQKHDPSSRSLGRRAVYLFGLVVTCTYFFVLIPTTVIAWQVRGTLRESQAVQRNKDLMINELNTISWRAREFAILPVERGGGGGSLEKFTLAPDMERTEQASYIVRYADGRLSVEATSLQYPDALISVTIGKDGYLRDWSYDGRFL